MLKVAILQIYSFL